jgi:chemotaxis protein methyltransferase CheR
MRSEIKRSTEQKVATVEGYEVNRDFPRVGRRIMLLNARKVFYEAGTHTTTLLAFEDITDRRAVEQQVQELLREKDILLQEMQHRVSNSLQIIASILLIKARTVQSEETRLQLEDAHNRVLSVAAVQQHLDTAGRGRLIEIGDYLSRLCETLAQSMIGDSRPISLKVEADAGTIVSHQAVSIGLIVTELVMNALKHAFPGEKKDAAILVSYKVSDTDWKLTVSDNGGGKPDLSASQKKGGLGASLVQSLAKQLDAQVNTASDATERRCLLLMRHSNKNLPRRPNLCTSQTRCRLMAHRVMGGCSLTIVRHRPKKLPGYLPCSPRKACEQACAAIRRECRQTL